MKRLTKGFTLAEVLITLAIIGVIASLTLPILNSNISEQQASTALSKAINTLENANLLAIRQNNVRTLEDLLPASNSQNYFDTALADYVKWNKEPLKKKYYSSDLKTAWNIKIDNVYTTNSGVSFMRESDNKPKDSSNKANLSATYSGRFYEVYVDVNGNSKGPNSLGKDLFALKVDTKGSVIPSGSSIDEFYSKSKSAPSIDRINGTMIKIDPSDITTIDGKVQILK